LLTLGSNGGMRFAFPPYGAPRVSVKGGWYYSRTEWWGRRREGAVLSVLTHRKKLDAAT